MSLKSKGDNNYDDEISKGLAELGLPADAERIGRIGFYLSELDRWNARYGFIKAGPGELVRLHLLDALAGLPLLASLVPAGRAVLDVGSGAGFPGLPLALFLTDRRFTLCERKATEYSFLTGIVALMGLGHVAVADDLVRLPAGAFDAVVFRAVTSLAEMYGLVRRLLAPRGILFAYKGKREKVEAEIAGLAEMAGEGGERLEAEAHEIRLAGAARERHIVVVRRSG